MFISKANCMATVHARYTLLTYTSFKYAASEQHCGKQLNVIHFCKVRSKGSASGCNEETKQSSTLSCRATKGQLAVDYHTCLQVSGEHVLSNLVAKSKP